MDEQPRIFWVVKTTSAVFGTEEFEYETEKEAWEGFIRLSHSQQEYMAQDGIQRSVSAPVEYVEVLDDAT